MQVHQVAVGNYAHHRVALGDRKVAELQLAYLAMDLIDPFIQINSNDSFCHYIAHPDGIHAFIFSHQAADYVTFRQYANHAPTAGSYQDSAYIMPGKSPGRVAHAVSIFGAYYAVGYFEAERDMIFCRDLYQFFQITLLSRLVRLYT